MSERQEYAAAFEREISSSKSVLIGTHRNPDGDALGSALALSHYLDERGTPNEVVCHNLPPKNLLFLPGIERVSLQPVGDQHDLGVLLDLDSTERLGDTAQYFAKCSRIVVVDHHVPHEKPGDLRIIDTSAPATSVILHRLLAGMGGPITPSISTCLLTGVVTDTGSFRYRNTTPEALAIASDLLQRGGDLNRVNEEIFQSKPLASTRLLGHMLGVMRMDCDDRLAWSTLSLEDFESCGASDEDTEGFVNELLFIDSVQVAALLREARPGRIRCSIRSKAGLDVASVARVFGGGGHMNAAGCTFDSSLNFAEDELVRSLRQCLESS